MALGLELESGSHVDVSTLPLSVVLSKPVITGVEVSSATPDRQPHADTKTTHTTTAGVLKILIMKALRRHQ